MRATSTVRAWGPAVRRAVLRAPGSAPAHLTGALGAVLAAASVVLVTQGRVLLHGCVAADGPLAALGLRFAVLRSADECPEGTLGLGAASQGAVLLLSVAVPVVAAHLLLAACGLGLGVVARRAWSAAGRVLAAGLPRPLLAVPAPLPAPAGATVPDVAVHVRRDRGHDPARPRRGPPGR